MKEPRKYAATSAAPYPAKIEAIPFAEYNIPVKEDVGSKTT
jgi:hypothetical protein